MKLDEIKAKLTESSHNLLERKKEIEIIERDRNILIGRMIQAEEMQKEVNNLQAKLSENSGDESV